MRNTLPFEIQQNVFTQFNVTLSVDHEGQFVCKEELSASLKQDIMTYIAGFTHGYMCAQNLAYYPSTHQYQRLRLDVSSWLVENIQSPLFQRLSSDETKALAYRLRLLTAYHPMNRSLFTTLQHLFQALADVFGAKWDLYLGKHNGFKAVFEYFPSLPPGDYSYAYFKRIFSSLHFEKTIIASQSIFHTQKLRRVFGALR